MSNTRWACATLMVVPLILVSCSSGNEAESTEKEKTVEVISAETVTVTQSVPAPATATQTTPASASETPAVPAQRGDVLVTATAPEGSEGKKNGIIKTGADQYELTGDYLNRDTLRDLPIIGWKPSRELKSCKVKISYLSADGREIAQHSGSACEKFPTGGSKEINAEWLDRSALPAQGTQAPMIIRVVVEGREETVEGELTITVKNPETYR